MRRKSVLFSAIFVISLFISTASVGRISAAGESAPINTDAKGRLSDEASFLDTETSLSAGSMAVDHSGSESQSALRNTTLQYKARNEKSISSSQILYDKKDEQRQEDACDERHLPVEAVHDREGHDYRDAVNEDHRKSVNEELTDAVRIAQDSGHESARLLVDKEVQRQPAHRVKYVRPDVMAHAACDLCHDEDLEVV